MSIHSYTSPVASGFAAARNTAVLQAAMAILLGFFVIGVVGFSHIDAVPLREIGACQFCDRSSSVRRWSG